MSSLATRPDGCDQRQIRFLYRAKQYCTTKGLLRLLSIFTSWSPPHNEFHIIIFYINSTQPPGFHRSASPVSYLKNLLATKFLYHHPISPPQGASYNLLLLPIGASMNAYFICISWSFTFPPYTYLFCTSLWYALCSWLFGAPART